MIYTKQNIIIVYVLMIIVALTLYGLWVASNDPKDEIFEIIMMIMIGIAFVASLFFFPYTAILISVIFVVVLMATLIVNYKSSYPVKKGTVYRNWMLGIGIGSIVPLVLWNWWPWPLELD